MKEIESTTKLTINGTATKQGADKIALRQVTLQGVAKIISAIGIAFAGLAYFISKVMQFH